MQQQTTSTSTTPTTPRTPATSPNMNNNHNNNKRRGLNLPIPTSLTKWSCTMTNSHPFVSGLIELFVCLAFLPSLLIMSFLFKGYDMLYGRHKKISTSTAKRLNSPNSPSTVPENGSFAATAESSITTTIASTTTNVINRPKLCVVITGASAGIGKSLMMEYARVYNESHKLCFGLIGTSEARLKQSISELQQVYGIEASRILYAVMDVRNREAMKEFIERVEVVFDGINVLVANAGVADYSLRKNHPQMEVSEIQHRVLDINLKGLMNTVLPIIDRLNREKITETGYWKDQSISICMVSSVFAEFSHSSFFTLVKKTVLEYGKFLRWTFVKNPHVSITVAMPGFVDTHIGQAFQNDKFMVLDPETTAELMREGIERGDEVIMFPLLLYIVAKLTQVLPQGLFEPINKVLKLET